MDINNIILNTKDDAKNVVNHLISTINDYGHVTVADLKEMIGLPAEVADIGQGWIYLRDLKIKKVPYGYQICLPELVDLHIKERFTKVKGSKGVDLDGDTLTPQVLADFCAQHGVSDIGEISDGYHTFNDLYYQRCVLFATLCNTFKDLAWKSRTHTDGTACFGGGWFIVGIDTPKGSYTYHYENKYWDLFDCREIEVAKEWDGHTSKDVERLLSLSNKEEEKPSMQIWAEREIELACKQERDNAPEGQWDYGVACYESALKAFNSLMGQGHTGMSIGITKSILNSLIDGRPLTPIEDTPDVWSDISDMSGLRGEEVNYQCKRMSSLFKYVYADGTVKYRDIDSHYCVDINDSNNTWHSGLVSRIIDEMFPVSLPYLPGRPAKVYCEEFLTDKKNGDFDTVGIMYAIKSDGTKIGINRFFKEAEKGWDEISVAAYRRRRKNKI